MWSNGTVISKQARRALEHERVTLVAHETGWIHVLYPNASIAPAAYQTFADKLTGFLSPPADAIVQDRVVPRLPDPTRVTFLSDDQPLGLTPEMTRDELSARLAALRKQNRAAALMPYAARDLGETESAPFIRAALMRNPVIRDGLRGVPFSEACARLQALEDHSIYDGSTRLAQPDEVWNFRTGDGLEKCLALAAVQGGTEIRLTRDTATLMDGEKALVSFPTVKHPKETVLQLKKD